MEVGWVRGEGGVGEGVDVGPLFEFGEGKGMASGGGC